ncbi:hypothetical protein FQN50_005093 [Emmonsiellopsis sp. PD_5]|nr:hypothetical protein FQN50_005093 [Emmonsiellopsis sp. PD_5]
MKSKTPSIPSKHSLITSPTLLPPQTTSYPTITHCNLLSCTFDSLTPFTSISHAYMRQTTIKSPPASDTIPSSPSGKPTATALSESSNISHAKIAHSTISASRIEQSDIRNSTISRAEFIGQTKCIDSTISGTGRIEHCKIKNSQCLPPTTPTPTPATATPTTSDGGVGAAGSSMKHSSIQGSTIGEACVIVQSKLCDVRVARSVVRDARVEDCDVEGCEITGGSFSGLWLRNGVWKGDELVGRVREGEEVVVKARGFAEIEERERGRERGREGGRGLVAELDGSGLVELPGDTSAPTPNHPQIPHLQDVSIPSLSSASASASASTASPAYEPNPTIQLPPSKEPGVGVGAREHTPASPSSDGYSSATGLVDEDREFTHVDQREVGLLNEKAAAPPPYEP